MKRKLYSLEDTKAQCFGPITTARTDGEATRHVIEAVSDPKSMLYKYPQDYRLVRIGEFDDNTGKITGTDETSVVIDCSTAIAMAAAERQAAAEAIGKSDIEDILQ